MRFRLTPVGIDTGSARRELLDLGAGGYVSFEGWVRDHNEGQQVVRLEYEAFHELAVKEGDRIVAEALRHFPVKHALCIHRVGALGLGDMAVWVQRWNGSPLMNGAGLPGMPMVKSTLPSVEHLRTVWSPSSVQ